VYVHSSGMGVSYSDRLLTMERDLDLDCLPPSTSCTTAAGLAASRQRDTVCCIQTAIGRRPAVNDPTDTQVEYYFASAATVAVDSSHTTAPSTASWTGFSPPSNFVNGHVLQQSGSWSVAGHNHGKVIG